MASEAILHQQPAVVIPFPPAVEVPDDLEANDPEEEYEAHLGEAVVWEGYFADKGVRS